MRIFFIYNSGLTTAQKQNNNSEEISSNQNIRKKKKKPSFLEKWNLNSHLAKD